MPPRLTRDSRFDFEDDCPMATRLARLEAWDADGNAAETEALRSLMHAIGMPKVCGRGRCRRAKRCLTRKVDCAFIQAPWLEAHVFAELDRASA